MRGSRSTGNTKYVIDRVTAWMLVALTFFAGVIVGFALLAIILSFNTN